MDRPDAEPSTDGLVAGDERAYAALYDRFGARLYRTALGIVRSRQDAEDAVQEVFLGVLKSRQKLRDVQDLTAYLFTALRRAAAHPPVDPRVRQNLALVIGLQGRFAEAETIARADLPPVQAAANVAYLKEVLKRTDGVRTDRGSVPIASLNRPD